MNNGCGFTDVKIRLNKILIEGKMMLNNYQVNWQMSYWREELPSFWNHFFSLQRRNHTISSRGTRYAFQRLHIEGFPSWGDGQKGFSNHRSPTNTHQDAWLLPMTDPSSGFKDLLNTIRELWYNRNLKTKNLREINRGVLGDNVTM